MLRQLRLPLVMTGCAVLLQGCFGVPLQLAVAGLSEASGFAIMSSGAGLMDPPAIPGMRSDGKVEVSSNCRVSSPETGRGLLYQSWEPSCVIQEITAADDRAAEPAFQQALVSMTSPIGATTSWKASNGDNGTITVTEGYTKNGLPCRHFEQDMFLKNKKGHFVEFKASSFDYCQNHKTRSPFRQVSR